MNAAFVDELRQLGDIRLDEPLSRHVTFGVGGSADVYIAARSEDQLRGAYALAKRHGVPVFIFGSGSNILVGDRASAVSSSRTAPATSKDLPRTAPASRSALPAASLSPRLPAASQQRATPGSSGRPASPAAWEAPW
jgi:hypothetical protein